MTLERQAHSVSAGDFVGILRSWVHYLRLLETTAASQDMCLEMVLEALEALQVFQARWTAYSPGRCLAMACGLRSSHWYLLLVRLGEAGNPHRSTS
jgi:hypothetical protein